MTYYPDGHPAFDMPEFNPEPPDEVEFPAEPDLVYHDGIRMELEKRISPARAIWQCPHGVSIFAATGEEAAENCRENCVADAYEPSDPKHPGYHDRMSAIWDEREGK